MKKTRIASAALVTAIALAVAGAGPVDAEPIRFSAWVLGQHDASLTSTDMVSIRKYVSIKCEWAAGSDVPPHEITAGGVQNGLYKGDDGHERLPVGGHEGARWRT